MNTVAALRSENSLRPQLHISLYAFYFTTYLSTRIFVYRWWTFSFRKNNNKGLLYFLSKMRQFSVKHLRGIVKLFSVLILSVSSSNFSFSLQSEPKVNLSLEIALSLLSPFALNGFISVIWILLQKQVPCSRSRYRVTYLMLRRKKRKK